MAFAALPPAGSPVLAASLALVLAAALAAAAALLVGLVATVEVLLQRFAFLDAEWLYMRARATHRRKGPGRRCSAAGTPILLERDLVSHDAESAMAVVTPVLLEREGQA